MEKYKQYLLWVAKQLCKGNKVKGWQTYVRTYNYKPTKLNAFCNKKLGLVIKQPTFILDDKTPDHVRVPTIKLDDGWVVQPIVKKVNLKLACDKLKEQLVNYKTGYPDIHCGNAGWHRGSPVLFDW